MTKIKIAHIITKLELGGAQKTTLSLLRHIDKERYEVYLITSSAGYLRQEACLVPELKVFFTDTLVRGINIFNDIISFFKIARYIRQQGISIVHTHSSKAGIIGRWAAWCAGVRLIFHTIHGWPFYIETGPIAKITYKISEKLTSHITTKLIVVSDADLKSGIKYVNKEKEKYIKIPYGIESANFDLQSMPAKSCNAIRVGFIACYKPQKSPFDFIKVAKLVIDKNKNIDFISAGDGVLKRPVMKEASRLGLDAKIIFLGWQDDIARVLRGIDILLLTSRWEGLPVVILEALASGIPVVATDAGGVSELVISGVNGFVEEKGACEKLANDILLLAGHEGMRTRFSRQAKKRFNNEFDIRHMANRIQNLYQKMEGGQEL
jgi:glycosyltransferase involved in cell wall biosynthesis